MQVIIIQVSDKTRKCNGKEKCQKTDYLAYDKSVYLKKQILHVCNFLKTTGVGKVRVKSEKIQRRVYSFPLCLPVTRSIT